MADEIRQSIRFYDDGGQLCVMNTASYGDCFRRDGKTSVYEFLTAQHGISTERVRCQRGSEWIWICPVRDKAALEAAAHKAGIAILS